MLLHRLTKSSSVKVSEAKATCQTDGDNCSSTRPSPMVLGRRRVRRPGPGSPYVSDIIIAHELGGGDSGVLHESEPLSIWIIDSDEKLVEAQGQLAHSEAMRLEEWDLMPPCSISVQRYT